MFINLFLPTKQNKNNNRIFNKIFAGLRNTAWPSIMYSPLGCQKIFLKTILQGFWYFAEKKAKFRGIFRGKFAEKSADFAGFSREKSQNSLKNRPISREKSQNSQKNRPISQDFSEKKSNFEGFLGQILRKIGRFHRKFWGETSPRNNQ